MTDSWDHSNEKNDNGVPAASWCGLASSLVLGPSRTFTGHSLHTNAARLQEF